MVPFKSDSLISLFNFQSIFKLMSTDILHQIEMNVIISHAANLIVAVSTFNTSIFSLIF